MYHRRIKFNVGNFNNNSDIIPNDMTLGESGMAGMAMRRAYNLPPERIFPPENPRNWVIATKCPLNQLI